MRVLLLAAFYLAQLAAGQTSSVLTSSSSSSAGPAVVSSSSVLLRSSSSSSTGIARSSSSSVFSSSSSSAPPAPSLPTICSGAGYSLESLRGQVITGQFSGFNYSIAVCGHVPSTSSCEAGTSFSQLDGNGCNYLMKWDANTTTTWTGVPNGVQVGASTGAMCGSLGPRRVNMEFRCNPAATTPRMLSVAEPSTCFYQAIIETSAVCSASSTGAAGGVGSTWYDYVCGGGLYDFSSIGDIVYDTNTTSSTSGYLYFVNICGRVQNSTCSSIQPTSVCQSNKGTSRWNLSFFNNSVANLHTLTADGMSINVATGDKCGSNPREALLNIHCNGAVPAVITSQSEYATCKYRFEINTVCPRVGSVVSSSTGAQSSSAAPQSSGVQSSSSVAPQSSSSVAPQSSSSVAPQPSTGVDVPTSVSSSTGAESSAPFVPEFPEGTVRVTMSVQLMNPVNSSNYDQVKRGFEADIADNIARATNVTASDLDGLVEVTSIGDITSSSARRLLQAETPLTFLILGNITRVVTNLDVDASLVAATVANALVAEIANGLFTTNNTGAVVPTNQQITIISLDVSSSTGSGQPEDDLNGAAALSQSMVLTVLCALVALMMAM